jgi:hypothetical protein
LWLGKQATLRMTALFDLAARFVRPLLGSNGLMNAPEKPKH